MVKTPFWPIPIGYKDIDLGLGRMWQALEKLGNPHQKLPKVIHFAGTNGKGSTLSFVKAILNSAGYRCHCYTSPHLVEFNERIVLADKKISDDFLNEILLETKNACEDIPNITFFEGTTLAAILAFSKVDADYVLLETGLGGNLDATNVIAQPELSVITPIDLDHTEFLGDTITAIAGEKARIMKANCKAVIAPQKDEALDVIKAYASEINCRIFQADNIIEIPDNEIGLAGEHQYINAAVARKCAEILNIDEEHIKAGIKNAKWPARLELIQDKRINEYLNLDQKDTSIYLDGGHNAQAAKAIAKFIDNNNVINNINDSNNYAIIAMLKTKDAKTFANNLYDRFEKVICINIPDDNDSANAEDIAKYFQNKGIAANSFKEALDIIKHDIEMSNNTTSNLYICGSLYLAGWVIENWAA